MYRYRGPWGPDYRRLALIRDEPPTALSRRIEDALAEFDEDGIFDYTAMVHAILEALSFDLADAPTSSETKAVPVAEPL